MSRPPDDRVPLVSVVTATYNALAALQETVRSVESQTLGSVEHVVVDGGSSDGTPAWLEGRKSSSTWISEPDDGIADAMNKGVALARGAYVLVLQAGDVIAKPGSLKQLASILRAAAELSPDVVVCDVLYGPPGTDLLVHVPSPRSRLEFKPVCHQGVLVKRTMFDEHGGFDTSFRVSMDYDFLLRLKRAGARFESVPMTLSRMDDTGVSSLRDWPSLHRRFDEERRIHRSHADGARRVLYELAWPPYLAYRWLRGVGRRLVAGD